MYKISALKVTVCLQVFFPYRDDEDNVDDWDEDKLQDVVNKKHGNERANQTDIVST